MAFSRTLTDESGTYDVEIVIESDGWSGRPLVANSADDHFQFDIWGEINVYSGGYEGYTFTCEPDPSNYGYCALSSGDRGSIIGLSLEHMGMAIDTDNEPCFQAVCCNPHWSYSSSWGAKETDENLRIECDDISVHKLKLTIDNGDTTTESYYNDEELGRYFQYISNIGIIFFRVRYVGDGTSKWRARIKTDLPIFETDADLLEYCQSGGTVTEKILNIGGDDPEEEYKDQFDFWYIKNKWGHNTRNSESSANTKKNYRFYPKRKGICFIKHTPTEDAPYDRILYHYSGYDAKYAAWGEEDDDDYEDNPNVTTHFLTKSISFGQNNYYTKFAYETNIPLWNNQQDADDYFNGLKDITEADNYAYIARQDNAILNPDLPGTEIDELTAVGTNGMRYSYGNRLYEITNVELSNLMTELFTPATAQSVIDGNKLFGTNTMEAVSGVIYIPLTSLDSVCEMGSLAKVRIGSWESQEAQGRRIIKNEGTIDCGSFFYNRVYQDYRDYEPYNLLMFNGPFVGCHQLTISKYIDRTVSCHYNLDITTGGIVCSLYADGILSDVFEGTCGASRPISATDNNAYINNIVSAITGASSQAQGSIMGLSNAVGAVGKAANVGALAAGGAAFGATVAAGAVGASGIYTAYQIQQAVDNPPQMHRGSLAGNLAYSLNTHPTFLFYTKRTIRPENELSLIGYPSGHGGVVGSFSGFLQCSAFKLANGFTGTERERQDILAIMRNGIYIE